MIQLISVTYKCSTCNKLFDSACHPAEPSGQVICSQCEMKYYFDVMFDEYPNPNNIIYVYVNGNETKLIDGFIRLICPTKSAILNNI